MKMCRSVVSLALLACAGALAACSSSTPSAPSAPLSAAVTDVYSLSAGYQPGDPPLSHGEAFVFSTHGPGTIEVTLDSWRTPYDGDFLSVDLVGGASVLAHMENCDSLAALVAPGCTSTRAPDGFTVVSPEAGSFVLKVSSERQLILAYHIRVTHPR